MDKSKILGWKCKERFLHVNTIISSCAYIILPIARESTDQNSSFDGITQIDYLHAKRFNVKCDTSPSTPKELRKKHVKPGMTYILNSNVIGLNHSQSYLSLPFAAFTTVGKYYFQV